MDHDPAELWRRYQKHQTRSRSVGINLDVSRMNFSPRYWSKMEPAIQQAYEAMQQLEAGAIANPDEKRMVGHYWLRTPELAPDKKIATQIRETNDRLVRFAREVHDKVITPPRSARFTDVMLVGIGGSALGPQLVADALGTKRDKMRVHFLDNTDPDGIRRLLESIQTRLKSTLVLVVSKSGSTPETRNGMLEVRAAFEGQDLQFAPQAVAITGEDSKLDKQAKKEKWLERFPMWDWVGGRTSVTSAVGLLPAALQGLDVKGLLDGAAEMDRLTRGTNTKRNPAARMALMWYHATNGKGAKDLVILPYKDRLLLLSRYLQQLIMESLGKETDLDGNTVHQGLSVYGNKGSTDQHAFVQQLREGLNNFFATFVIVQQDVPRPGTQPMLEVDPDISSGDYLLGFWQGTRQALYENGRESMTLALDKLDAKSLGALIALYERAVGFYASLVNINAYHQPGVEAGKKAAASVLELQKKMIAYLKKHPDDTFSPEDLAAGLKQPEHVETLFHLLEHLAANKRHVARHRNRFAYLS
ncbi:glucose-6-phosphate isomerase [Phycisphaerales bacterium AB-hyl4]|uniref:Glucose-6-phosphate isomerase n=1 Tax=Natronomicrosphaera hydrolytica TaxID=3242702 RepID=A0ABV4U2J7_9BACT